MDPKIEPVKGQKLYRVLAGAVVRADPSAPSDAPILCCVSDGSVDRYNSIVKQDGWDLENHNRNPVVLWSHDHYTPAIGRAQNTRIEKDRLLSELVFAARGAHALADTVQDLLRSGILNAVSASWIPKKWAYDEERGGYDYLENELIEWSPVNVPGNANALVEGRSAGIDVEPVLRHIEETARREGWIDPKTAETLRMGAGSKVFSFGARGMTVAAPTSDELSTLVDRFGLKVAAHDDEPADEGVKCADCGEDCDPAWKFCAACGTKRGIEKLTPEDIKAAVRAGLSTT